MTSAVWFVALERSGHRAEWDWPSLGAPDPTELFPVRHPASGDFSRHIPRTGYSVTIGEILKLESGLEHDLVKWLDLRRDVTWLVAQPVLLHFPLQERRRAVIHTPDLLSQHSDGSVTLWDARSAEHHDEMFRYKAALTDEACHRVGWGYRVFDGLPPATRINLLWLAGFRRQMPWYPARTRQLRALLEGREIPVVRITEADDGSGELLSSLWHLIATGAVTCALDEPISGGTTVRWSDGLVDAAAWRLTADDATHVDDLTCADPGDTS